MKSVLVNGEKPSYVHTAVLEQFKQETGARLVDIFPGDRSLFHLDFGGSIVSRWEPVCVEQDGIRFEFWAHQLDQVVHALHNLQERNGFCVVSGYLWQMAAPRSFFELVCEQIKKKWPEYKQLQQDNLDQWDRAAQLCASHPNLDPRSPKKTGREN